MRDPTIFTRFLDALGVPHTAGYSDGRYEGMTFKSLFGLSKLLDQYGIDNEALRLDDKNELDKLMPPFLAQGHRRFVVVTSVSHDSVTYMSTDEKPVSVSRDTFVNDWTGVVLLAYPSSKSSEPDYRVHRNLALANKAKTWVMVAALAFLWGYLFAANGIWRHVSTVLIMLIDVFGLYITYLLLLKQLSIKSHAADRVCSVLQEGGCNTVLATKASKFFGLFGWSEVGFSYFGVSLLALLVFPQSIGCLALANLCCLPFTAWSLWYQKFRAGAWCTLCVTVQASLWLLFFCYFLGGWYRSILPFRVEMLVLGASYLAALLVLNKALPAFDRRQLSI